MNCKTKLILEVKEKIIRVIKINQINKNFKYRIMIKKYKVQDNHFIKTQINQKIMK